MNLVDHLAALAALFGGGMIICHAYLAGQKGFPNIPFLVRGCMVTLGLCLWLRAGMIYPSSDAGYHVAVTEMLVYGAFAVMLSVAFGHYFLTAHRWYGMRLTKGNGA